MKTLRVGLLGAILVFITACASLGIEPARSFQDRIDYANGAITAIAKTTSQGVTAGSLTVAEAKSVQEVAKQASALLDAAATVGDSPAGQQNLSLAIALLQNLQTYLSDRVKS